MKQMERSGAAGAATMSGMYGMSRMFDRLDILARPSVCVLALFFAACDGSGESSSTTAEPAAASGAESGPATARCDSGGLNKLSGALGSMPPLEGAAAVWPGLKLACGDALPAVLTAYFDFAQGQVAPGPEGPVPMGSLKDAGPLKEKACANYSEVTKTVAESAVALRPIGTFLACKFDRYDVITRAEAAYLDSSILSFTTHQWLLDSGSDAATLKPITRALLALEGRTSWLVQPHVGEHWPVAQGESVVSGMAVSVTPSEIWFNEQKLAPLKDGVIDPASTKGHLIAALYDQLVEEVDKAKQLAEQSQQTWDGRLVLAADENTPFSTLVDVLYTAGRAEFSTYSILVADPNGLGYGQINVSPPRFVPRGPEGAAESAGAKAIMTVELTPGAYSLSQGAHHEGEPVAGTSADYGTLAAYAKTIHGADEGAHEVVLSASNETPLREVVSALVAARGADCLTTASECVLPDAVVMAGSAHRSLGGALNPIPKMGSEFKVGAGPFGDAFGEGIDHPDPWGDLVGVDGKAFGEGGLGLVGTGRGASNAEEGTIGLGSNGLVGGKRVPRVRQAKATVKGALDKDIIRRVVRAHINEVRACYNEGLAKDPKLQGRIAINFVITPSGTVGSAVVQQSTIRGAQVPTCVAKAVKRWKFPKPQGGGNVIVTYPFTFSPD